MIYLTLQVGFNSKLVRLKGLSFHLFNPNVPRFQFQIGSIKRRFIIPEHEKQCYVSIPNWFD